MKKAKLIDTYKLPAVDNVCDQVLREVISLPKVSMAHVIMNQGNVSLWHRHSQMSEIYFVLGGEGILYHGDKRLIAKGGTCLVLPPNTPHKLQNTGDGDLEHLVLATPPFNPEDVEILKYFALQDFTPQEFQYSDSPITALDGALIYELMSSKERKELDVALAVGFLPAARKAIPHYHKISEELYYVISGTGKARVDDQNFNMRKGSMVYIPTNAIHALENTSDSEELEILCVSSPSYSEGDFIFDK